MKTITNTTTLCGLDCFNCEFNEVNLTDAIALKNELKYEIAREELICKGCDILKKGDQIDYDSFNCCNTIQSQKYCHAYLTKNFG